MRSPRTSATSASSSTAQLRDLKYTAPYMHNGMFATLDDVIDFYDKGGGKGSVLKPLNLSAAEKKALKEFLLTLSGDLVIVKDPGPARHAGLDCLRQELRRARDEITHSESPSRPACWR
jgi:hypothetical protein